MSYTFGMEIEMLVPDLLQTHSSGLLGCPGSWRCCLGLVRVPVYGSVSPLFSTWKIGESLPITVSYHVQFVLPVPSGNGLEGLRGLWWS